MSIFINRIFRNTFPVKLYYHFSLVNWTAATESATSYEHAHCAWYGLLIMVCIGALGFSDDVGLLKAAQYLHVPRRGHSGTDPGGSLGYLGGCIRSLSKLKNTPKALISGQKSTLILIKR